jgi:hypothetical protein
MKKKTKATVSKPRSAAKPAAKAVKKPAAKATKKPVAKPVAKSKSVAKPATKPAAKKNVVNKKVTPKPTLKTSKKTMTKTAAKTATKTGAKVASKPTAKTVLGQPTVSTAPLQAINEGAQMTQSNQATEDAGASQPITGRGVFAVRTLGAAVSVEAAFLAEDGNVLRLPAVFPNRQYAIEQIDELRDLVNRHFDELDKAST